MKATPEAIAAAWATWRPRHGGKRGPGPAFVEAIEAALATYVEGGEELRQFVAEQETLGAEFEVIYEQNAAKLYLE